MTTTMWDLHLIMLPISLRRIQICSIQHSSLYFAILWMDVSKLLSRPSLAAERHSKDNQIIVQAQVSSRPLCYPSPVLSPNNTLHPVQDEHPHLDSGKMYSVTTQLNFTLSEIFTSLECAKLRTISCLRHNDSGSPNLFDKHHIKSQIQSLLLPDLTARKTMEYIGIVWLMTVVGFCM